MDIDLDQARRRARELLRDARAGDPGALVRMRADRAPRLTDAQRAVAAELGFAFWPALVAHSRWHPVTAGVAHDPEETALLLARGSGSG